MDINNLLLDLEVIKQIKENDKLALCILPGSTKLLVDTSHILSGITRRYNGYCRETCIVYLETLVENIEKSTAPIISGQHHELAETLKSAIFNSLKGLDNLKVTYSKDSVINARLVLCSNKLSNVISLLQNFLDSTGSLMQSSAIMTPIDENLQLN